MEWLVYGVFLGLVNGMSPGPTLTMVITQTMQHNLKEGIKIALAPILFGFFIIPLCIFVLSGLSSFRMLIILISVVGALYLIYLGVQLIKFSQIHINTQNKLASFRKGLLINFTSPYAYIFWLTVGSPFLVRLLHDNLVTGILFIVGYYFALVGSKVIVAIIINKYKDFLDKKIYVGVLRSLGVLLLFFAFVSLREASKQF